MCAEYYLALKNKRIDHSCPYYRQGHNVYFSEGTGENGYGMDDSQVGHYPWTYSHSARGASFDYYDEIRNYNFSDPKGSFDKDFWIIGHFTQMIWRETKEFGVGLAWRHEGDHWWLCGTFMYYPCGNFVTPDREEFSRIWSKNVKPPLPDAPPPEIRQAPFDKWRTQN